ncbi:L-glutamate gamma-semialdehyde dehydrogenase [candidate division LCP-89 bacterium B3_LCP]|uniref:L-glutamate gamma-semialdehyde dehydrogenase n=1 Tax=candidate division LCP-89 bacterium B3_LCP TaxID=2012998 RepID=A0A532V5I0_UNCL8|nr:MAG: L-glutamate gamma-semialdehyde dehydrogenase [candidate division LCP-89 bacterium B3_LCP]
MLPEFVPTPFTDFSKSENRQEMIAALDKVQKQLGITIPLVIGGKEIVTDDKIVSLNCSKYDEVVANCSKGSKEQAEKAIATADETFKLWSRVAPDDRARYLIKAAAIMKRRRRELAAWMIYEVGKNWLEADADVAEAIDFLEFYGREMMRYGQPQPVIPYPGEENELYYIPLGVGAVIPPWNFPLAILCGMTSAAIVAGNTVILKPASTAPAIGYQFYLIMKEAGLPDGVLNFLPGPGSKIGDTIVDHPRTRFIAFTGSMEVGLRIHERAAKKSEGQIWIKRTVLEMGGKDFIAVDESADLDAAAQGIVAAAFGFQGQKCSACSRAIVHESVYDEVVAKVVEKAKPITIGEVKDQDNFMGGVVDEAAYNKILEYIEIGKKEGELVLGGGKGPDGGYFIQPTIIKDVDEEARIAQEEIFGPVLAFIKAKDFEHIIAIANGTEFGLTGALYSGNRGNLEVGRRELHAGNLYLNRKCTGALVGVQPFGGFNMSGTDSKAGGRDYLALFTQGKAVCEQF